MKEFVEWFLELFALDEVKAIDWDEYLSPLGELRWVEWGLTSEGLPAFWSEVLRVASQSILRGEPQEVARELLSLKRGLNKHLGLNEEEQPLFDREYALFRDYVMLLGGREVTSEYQVEGEWITQSRIFIRSLFYERLHQIEVDKTVVEAEWPLRLSLWIKEFKLFDALSRRLLIRDESGLALSLYSYHETEPGVHSSVFNELLGKLTKYCQQLLRLINLWQPEEGSVRKTLEQLSQTEELWLIAKRHRLLPELASYKVFADLEQLYRRVEEEISSADTEGVSFVPQVANKEPVALMQQIGQDMEEMKRYGEGLTRLAGMESLRDEGAGIDLYFKAFQWIDKTFRAYSEELYAHRMETERLLRERREKTYLAQLSALDKELLAIDGRLLTAERACLQEVNVVSGKESLRQASDCLDVLVSDAMHRLSGMLEWFETTCYCQARTEGRIAPEMNARNDESKKIEQWYGVGDAFTQTDYLATKSARTQEANSALRQKMRVLHSDQLHRRFPKERHPQLHEIASYCFQQVEDTQERLRRAQDVWYAGQWYAPSPDTLELVEEEVFKEYSSKQPVYLKEPSYKLDLKALCLKQEYLSWADEQPNLNKQLRWSLGSQHHLHAGSDDKDAIAWTNLLYRACHALLMREEENRRRQAAALYRIGLLHDEIVKCEEEIKQIREETKQIREETKQIREERLAEQAKRKAAEEKNKLLKKLLLKAMIRDLKEQFEGADNLRELLLDEIASRFYSEDCEEKRPQVLNEDLELAIGVFQAAGHEHWAACLKNDVIVNKKAEINLVGFFAHKPLGASANRVLRCDKSDLFNPL